MEAVKLSSSAATGVCVDFTYFVIEKRDDRRSAQRRRTRLRSGKILDSKGGFRAECQVYDRSETGARLRVLGDARPPDKLCLFEDRPEKLSSAVVVWRNDREVGIRFTPYAPAPPVSPVQLAFLRGRYYAIAT